MKASIQKAVALIGVMIATCVVSIHSTKAYAQTFNAPSTLQQTYGTGIADILHTSAYDFDFGNFGIYLAGWDGSWGGTVSVRKIGHPGFAMINQQMLPYGPGIRDLEVGMLEQSNNASHPFQILVAYHVAGTGHQIDFYDFNPFSFNIVFAGTQTLSTWTPYTRISMDCHITYACAVTWEENDIRVATWDGAGAVTAGPSYNLIGTASRFTPDIAFTHNMNLNLNIVYLDPPGGTIYTEVGNFWTLHTGGGGAVGLLMADINFVGPGVGGTPNIDGWDHGTDDWAYTWTHDDTHIFLRTWNATIGTTSIVNDGSLSGITPTTYAQNLNPFLACDQSGQGIAVVWYFFQDIQEYIGVTTNNTGTAITNTPDYYQIPTAPGPTANQPFISLSKMTEFGPRLYTVFPQDDGSSAMINDMRHRYHDWSSVLAYKAEHADCRLEAEVETAVEESAMLFPNPFTENTSLKLPEVWQTGEVNIKVIDISGRSAGSFYGTANQVGQWLNATAVGLESGTYFIELEHFDSGVKQSIQIQKM